MISHLKIFLRISFLQQYRFSKIRNFCFQNSNNDLSINLIAPDLRLVSSDKFNVKNNGKIEFQNLRFTQNQNSLTFSLQIKKIKNLIQWKDYKQINKFEVTNKEGNFKIQKVDNHYEISIISNENTETFVLLQQDFQQLRTLVKQSIPLLTGLELQNEQNLQQIIAKYEIKHPNLQQFDFKQDLII